jgi:hypothetical protein
MRSGVPSRVQLEARLRWVEKELEVASPGRKGTPWESVRLKERDRLREQLAELDGLSRMDREAVNHLRRINGLMPL